MRNVSALPVAVQGEMTDIDDIYWDSRRDSCNLGPDTVSLCSTYPRSKTNVTPNFEMSRKRGRKQSF